jgi:DNA polymerase III alpha subunit (gram-positive type)
MEILVGDLETNGLKPNIIWAVGVIDMNTDEYTAYVGEDEVPIGLMRLAQADRVVGHNFRGYDAKVIRDLTEGLITIDDAKIDDTVELSRVLFPEMPNHKLGTWGEIFGFPKLDFKNFDKFDPEMLPYMERDVRLNKMLYQFFLDHLATLDQEER